MMGRGARKLIVPPRIYIKNVKKCKNVNARFMDQIMLLFFKSEERSNEVRNLSQSNQNQK